MTFAPRYFATWIPALPRPPDAPITSTQSPDFSPAMSRSMLKATGAWRATTVATAKSTPSGIGCVHATGTFTYCAYPPQTRSEEHTSELQSHHDLVCRLLLEKKKKI